ncbi:MAG TPA: tetratricopeptide repeat protein [Candidatus Limnocylindria bacterium]|nr:tetratricopeptide repeat protein [Candidatus Limnocylindria bacterium]
MAGRTLSLVMLAFVLAGCGLIGGSGSKSEADLAADALNRGLKAHNAGNYDEATKAYFETLFHDPRNKFAYFNLGQIAQTQKRPQVAEGYYRSALDIDAKFGSALFNLAIIRNDAGAKQEAVDLYRRDIQADPNNGAAYYNLGLLLRETGSTAEADQMLQRAQQIDPRLVPPPAPSPTPTARPSATR